jgi:hypothetical protein
MYFDFEDNRPDTPTIGSPMSNREVVLVTFNLHLIAIIMILVAPQLPFMREFEARRQQALQELQQRELEREREAARFVFVQPRVDMPSRKPPPRADLSDLDRRARTMERAPNPKNPLPFSRGNSPERMEASAPVETRQPAAPQPAPQPSPPQPEPDTRQGLTLPDAPSATDPRAADKQTPRGPAAGVIADAIRNVQKYAAKDQFSNPQGGADQDFAPSIQFDTKGVEFGPWLRRFIAQMAHSVRRDVDARPRGADLQRPQGRPDHGRVGPASVGHRRVQSLGAERRPDDESHAAPAARVSRREGVLHRHLLLQRNAADRPMTWPTRSQQIGLLTILAALVALALVRALTAS